MSCETVIGSMVSLLDGELAGAERRVVEEHIAGCGACQGELRALQATRALVSRSLRAGERGAAWSSFDDLWARIEQDEPVPNLRRAHGRLRRGAAAPGALRRRRALWVGAGGFALAASLALLIVGLPFDRQGEVAPAPARVASQPPTVAARPEPKADTLVAAAAKPKPAPAKVDSEATVLDTELRGKDTSPEGAETAVVVNEIDPPRELLERPDLFLNYPIVRKLDELQHLESVLADSADGGSAG